MIKSQISDLAFFGGKPAFEQKLHVGRPNLGNRDRFIGRVNEIFDNRWFSNNGPFVQEFERKLAEYTGAKHCIAMCNGTIALEIAIKAAGLKGEVIVPSFTFVATAHALQWQEITPVFCDIDPNTHCLDPKKVEELITPRTTGIVGVHVWGRPCAIDSLEQLAKKHKLKLIYDAAHAFGASHKGRMIGNFGDAEIYSFHATKFFNTFEGGALVTNDDELGKKARLMTNFGFSGYDNVIYVGTNGKMTEISAAMGLTAFESLDETIEKNRLNHSIYSESLAGIPGLKIAEYDAKEKNNFQYVILEVDSSAFGLSRDEINQLLHPENVLARRYFYPGCHQMEPYRSEFPEAGKRLPQTERLTGRVMSLPSGTAVSNEDIQAIAALIRFFHSNANGIRKLLAEVKKD